MRHMRQISILLLVLPLLLPIVGCQGSEDSDSPTAPGGQTANYDGTWVANLGPFDYPVRGLEVDIQGNEFVHARLTTFWDLSQCLRKFNGRRFDPAQPVPIIADAFVASALVNNPETIGTIGLSFSSITSATGTITVTLDAGGTCQDTQTVSFTATKK